MRLGLVQLNPVVGDLTGNVTRIVTAVTRAFNMGAQLCITPEMALVGYPPRDLLLYDGFIRQAGEALEELALRLAGTCPVLAGGIEPRTQGDGKPLWNAAFLLQDGKIERTFRKSLLPSYDVFDETRYFEPSWDSKIVEIQDMRLAVTICEDIWNDKGYWPRRSYAQDPLLECGAAGAGVEAIINLSASPYHVGKQRLRESMLGRIAQTYRAGVVYVNQCGGNDDLVFDGRSVVVDRCGQVVRRLRAFAEDVAVVDISELQNGGHAAEATQAERADLAKPRGASLAAADIEAEATNRPELGNAARGSEYLPSGWEVAAWAALVVGTRDYVAKCGFKRVLLGLSGGIDSALTAVVAAHALGPGHVLGVLMPSPYSSKGSVDDSLALAANLGIATEIIPIGGLMQGFDAALAAVFDGLAADITEENIQARIRGNLLMAISNKRHAMLLTTGNKSELAVGYCTIYGDMSGGLAVISDVPKTMVYALARYVNRTFGSVIPQAIIDKPPSAELRPGQKDQDSLPPYDVLDDILRLHIERQLSSPEIIAKGFDPAVVAKVLRLVANAEFKRRQAAPGLRITARAFGTGWRMPIACVRPL